MNPDFRKLAADFEPGKAKIEPPVPPSSPYLDGRGGHVNFGGNIGDDDVPVPVASPATRQFRHAGEHEDGRAFGRVCSRKTSAQEVQIRPVCQ